MGEAGSPTLAFLWIALVVTVLWVAYLVKLIRDAHQGRTPLGRRRRSLRSRVIMWRAGRRLRKMERGSMASSAKPTLGSTPGPVSRVSATDRAPSQEPSAQSRDRGSSSLDGGPPLHPAPGSVNGDDPALSENGDLTRRVVDGAGPMPRQAESPDGGSVVFEAVELVRASTSVSLPDRLEHRVLGRYPTCLKAILRIEARRQAYRRDEDRVHRWFYVRGPGSGEPVWFVEGVDSEKAVVDLRDQRMPQVEHAAPTT